MIAAMKVDAHPKIVRDPKIMMGKPIIAGTRVPVEAVVRQFAAGADMAWVLNGFPDLGEEDVRAALEYALCLHHNLMRPRASAEAKQ